MITSLLIEKCYRETQYLTTMGKIKPKDPSENDDTEDDAQSLPRTRRRTKLQITKQEDITSDEEDSPAPAPRSKAPPKTRKVIAPASESPTTEAPLETTLAPHLRKRKGGNKRRFTHEYCLTCQHYGRACGGRRDDQDGCAICRDPNREKGEKLRECLWANPAAGITTYEEARVAHKEAQLEKRARDKAKAQELKRASAAQTNGGKNNSSASKVSAPQGPPPPVRRQLDVMPPPSATVRSPSFFIPPVLKRQNEDSDTITVDTSTMPPSPTMSHLPGINGEPGPRIHRPRIIRLRVNGSYDKESVASSPTLVSVSAQPIRSDQQLSPSSRPWSFVPPPIPRVPPYYDIQIQAWRYPSEPGTYVTPSDIPATSHPTYQSPYGHPPAFTSSASDAVVDQSDIPPSSPTTNHIKTRPLDRSGTPCKKWARTGSDAGTTISGYPLKMQVWRTEEANRNDNAIDEPRDDISTSDLSSVIDVDDPREFEKAVRDAGIRSSPCSESSPLPHPIILREEQDYVVVHNQDGAAEETQENGEEEDEDRLQTQINRMAREAEMKFSTHSRNPSKSDIPAVRPKIVLRASMISKNSTAHPTNVQIRAQNIQEGSDDESSGTEDEGPLKRLPLEIRNKLSRTATTHIRISETETITVRPEHFKGESLRRRSESVDVDDSTAGLPPWTRRKSSGRLTGEENGQKRSHNGGAKVDSDVAVEDEDDHDNHDEDEEVTVNGESEDQDVEMLEV